MLVAAEIRLGRYRRFVCTPDLLTLRGISPGVSDRRKIWLDWVCPAQCQPRHRYCRRDGGLYMVYPRGSGETEGSRFRKIRIRNLGRRALPSRRVDHPIRALNMNHDHGHPPANYDKAFAIGI